MAGWLFGIRGLNFSWKRFWGITNIKRWIARITGISTTRTGRFAKLGRLLAGFVGLFRIATWGTFLVVALPELVRKMKRRLKK